VVYDLDLFSNGKSAVVQTEVQKLNGSGTEPGSNDGTRCLYKRAKS
jgi:hypothetical protein